MRNLVFVKPPQGKEELIQIFGNIYNWILEDGTLRSWDWENKILNWLYLPFPMILSWSTSSIVKFKCHFKLRGILGEIFNQIFEESLENECRYFGGCYSFRCQKGSIKLSTHAWGIAIDINPITNQLGTKGNMHPKIVDIFESHGFVWGGRFKRLDPQHFQFVKEY